MGLGLCLTSQFSPLSMSQTAQEIAVTVETAESLGLLPEEFERIQRILGRIPNFNELSIFSVMWSEHCSYKNSIQWLKTLPRDGARLLVGAGEENAGLVDIGDGLACAFKVESHNHPSAIEPYQGAATGVGGIHRDIFTMGARPIAAMNSLRFGRLSNERTRHLLRGVVKGIGDYGNCFGVPTVGGEIYFEHCYRSNPLVNAMSVGIVEVGKTCSATAEGVGNPVYIVGSRTGKDGIHGATFASGDLGEDSAEDLPAVQVGDPFQEKLLLEASLEAIATGAVVGMQDMGAAGITCSTSEMSDKGGCGMRIDLSKVPTRQKDMKPWEILLSESQERMLVVVHKGREAEIQEVFDKWDLPCEQIGEVTEGGQLEFFMGAEKIADLPAYDLVLGGGAPVYDREVAEPEYIKEIESFDAREYAVPSDMLKVAQSLIAHPNLCSRRWVYEQYDSMVGTDNASTNELSDASVIRLKGRKNALAVSIDGNGRYVHANPRVGAMIAVAEAARNITCSGGVGVAITNCLNFGNPYVPEIYWQFVEAIKGMGEACRKFGTPVTGGNVSFYNQTTDEDAVYPTPVIGMLGLLDDIDHQTSLSFKKADDVIIMLGKVSDDLGSSVYLKSQHQVDLSPVPYFNLDEEINMQRLVRKLIRDGLVCSAHDVADGGLFINLIESAMASGLAFDMQCSIHDGMRLDGILFGEAQGRIVISASPADVAEIQELAAKAEVECTIYGKVQTGNITVEGRDCGSVSEWQDRYERALELIMEQ